MENDRKARRKAKKTGSPQKWIIIGVTLIIIVAVLFGTYYLVSNRANSSYISFLKSVETNVDKINSDNAKLTADIDGLDYKNVKEIDRLISGLTKNNSELQKNIDELGRYNPIAKYKEQFQAFKDGVAANKKIYDQVIVILRSPTNKDISIGLKNLDGYISNASNLYDSSKIGKVHIVLPNEIVNLSASLQSFTMKAVNDNEAKIKLLEQYTNYFNEMYKVVTDFQGAKIDFAPYIDQMEAGKKTVQEVRSMMDEKMVDISSINSAYDAITPPAKLGTKFKNFDSIIKGYFTYIQEYRQLLIDFEEAGGDTTRMNELGDELGQLDNSYQTISDSFEKYLSELNDDKYTYQDPNNF